MTACALYRHFDELGTLLYVGITSDVARRTSSHATAAEWVQHAKRGSIEWYPSEAAAAVAEAHVIRTEGPIFNRAYAVSDPDERIASYLERRRRTGERHVYRPRVIPPGAATNLVTLSTASSLLGLPRTVLANFRAREKAEFPKWVQQVGQTYLYDLEALERFLSNRPQAGAN